MKYTVEIKDSGTVYYYKKGTKILHREDGPAVERYNGIKEWYIHGKLHREDGPAIIDVFGDKYWLINGKRHREDGPAIECYNGDKWWCINGELHREDGPAVEFSSGKKWWYINGKELTEEEFNNRNKLKTLIIELDGIKYKVLLEKIERISQ